MTTASPPPGEAVLAAIARQHGFGAEPVRPMESTGLVNRVFAIGDRAVLRIPSGRHPGGIADAYTESVAVPAVHAAGIRTPRLLAFDDTRQIVDVPYTIYRRVVGADLGQLSLNDPAAPAVYHALGQELARLHSLVTTVDDPHGRLDKPDRWRTPEFAEPLFAKGFLDRHSLQVIADVFDRLRASLPEVDTYRRFLHQDLKTSNVMGHDGSFAAMIDWGDAGWGDPALDFRYLPMRAASWALDGYRQVMPLDGDADAEARILWDQIWCAVHQLDRRPDPAPRGSNRDRPGSRLIDLLGFLASTAGQAWLERTGR